MNTMRFKVDENLPEETAEILKNAGYDAVTVIHQNMSGDVDKILIAACQQEDRVLISLDLDFADIRAYPPSQFPCLIVLRVKRQDKSTVCALVERIASVIDPNLLRHKLWIVDEERIRIRE